MNSDAQSEAIEKHVESAIDEICQNYKKNGGNRSTIFQRMFRREDNSRLRKQYINENPERFIERTLVWPILTSLGFEYENEKKISERGRADFVISNTSEEIIGEVKILGNTHEGVGQVLRYFETTEYEYAIVTDGLSWELIQNGKTGIASVETLCHGELRGIVVDYALEDKIVDREIIELADRISPTSSEVFSTRFDIESIDSLI